MDLEHLLAKLCRAYQQGELHSGTVSSYSVELQAALSTDIVQALEERLQMPLLSPEDGNNICFAAQNKDLRDDYKIGFTHEELLYSFRGSFSGHSSDAVRSGAWLFAEWTKSVGAERDFFWKLVARGKATEEQRQ